MLSVRIEYLRGVCVATAFNDRSLAEWPPHPARLFSALVDAWADDAAPDQESALRWLEEQPPPRITASEANHRAVHPVFVPVNDATVHRNIDARILAVLEAEERLEESTDPKSRAAAEKARAKASSALDAAARKAVVPDPNPSPGVAHSANQVLPHRRVRQPRTFPAVVPHDPVVYMTWPTQPTDGVRSALEGLLERVHRIGHSSSLVACSLVEAAPDPTLVPDDRGDQVLRWIDPGQLDRLDRSFEHHRGSEPRVHPSRFVRYGAAIRPASPEPKTVFGSNWIVLQRTDGPRLPITRASAVARALRGALLKHAPEPIRPVLSGHGEDGGPLDAPHVAFVPLPYVGSKHADGRLMGVAVVLPSDASPEDEVHIATAVGRAARDGGIRLVMGRGGEQTLSVVRGTAKAKTLQSGSWVGPSRVWHTATPIALDRNPGDLRSSDGAEAVRARTEAEAILRLALQRIGLPDPVAIAVDFRPTVVGAEHIRHHPSFPLDRSRTQRVQVHARVVFGEKVRGPLLVGAGRYAGLGLMVPIVEEEAR